MHLFSLERTSMIFQQDTQCYINIENRENLYSEAFYQQTDQLICTYKSGILAFGEGQTAICFYKNFFLLCHFLSYFFLRSRFLTALFPPAQSYPLSSDSCFSLKSFHFLGHPLLPCIWFRFNDWCQSIQQGLGPPLRWTVTRKGLRTEMLFKVSLPFAYTDNGLHKNMGHTNHKPESSNVFIPRL